MGGWGYGYAGGVEVWRCGSEEVVRGPVVGFSRLAYVWSKVRRLSSIARSGRRLHRPGRAIRGGVLAEGVVAVGVFVEAGDKETGVDLAADLVGEGVAPFERVGRIEQLL